MANEFVVTYEVAGLTTITGRHFRGSPPAPLAVAQPMDDDDDAGVYVGSSTEVPLEGDLFVYYDNGHAVDNETYKSDHSLSDYSNGIWIDDNNAGGDGQVVGVNGLPYNPSRTFADAKALALAIGFNQFFIAGGSNIVAGAGFENARFIGIDAGSKFTLQNQNFDNCFFHNLELISSQGGTGRIRANECQLTGISNALITANRCQITGSIGVRAGDQFFNHCVSGVAGNGTPDLTFNSALQTNVNFRLYSGGLNLIDMLGVNHTLSYDCPVGQLVIDSSCNGGVITRRGAHNLTNAGTAMVITDLSAVDRDGIVQGLKDSTGWTAGGTWSFAKLIKALFAWTLGDAGDKGSGSPGVANVYDAEDGATPVMEVTPSETSPYKDTNIL